MSAILVYLIREQETILYAAEELCKYINIMAARPAASICGSSINIDQGGRQALSELKLGLFDDFGIAATNLADVDKDDAVHVEVINSQGIIAGSNPRSVLFAVYRFLQANGCRWIRPGEDGELVPLRKVENLKAGIFSKAFYRFRGNTGGGSAGPEEKLQKIDWMAKVGLNTFYHEGLLDYLPVWHDQLIKAAKKRGMFYHSAGHGWPAAFFNVPSDHYYYEAALAERAQKEKHYLALVDGKRETGIHARKPKGGAKNTELCYGNQEVRSRLVRCVADYAQRYPEVDMVHFWLSDGMNIHCECELCKDTRPSDFYVMLLNGIDEELRKRGMETRIVFLVYQDLMWAPETQAIKNPDRFVMMFAPISRRFNEYYSNEADESQIGDFCYNRNTAVKKMAGLVAAVNNWRRVFKGESFVFDYHMTWYHYYDFGYYWFAEGMAEDIKRLPVLGQDGFISCQIVCAALPTGFPLYVHAAYLWNPEEDFKRLSVDYFKAAFGRDGEQVHRYMERLSELSCRHYLRQLSPSTNSPEEEREALDRLFKVPETVENFKPVIDKNRNETEMPYRQSWEYLHIHAEMVLLLAEALREKFSGNNPEAKSCWYKTVEYIEMNKDRIKAVFDPFWFAKSYKRIFGE